MPTALIALFFPLARLLLIIFDIFLEGPVAGPSGQFLATGVHGKEVDQEEHIAPEEKTNVRHHRTFENVRIFLRERRSFSWQKHQEEEVSLSS